MDGGSTRCILGVVQEKQPVTYTHESCQTRRERARKRRAEEAAHAVLDAGDHVEEPPDMGAHRREGTRQRQLDHGRAPRDERESPLRVAYPCHVHLAVRAAPLMAARPERGQSGAPLGGRRAAAVPRAVLAQAEADLLTRGAGRPQRPRAGGQFGASSSTGCADWPGPPPWI